MTEKLEIVIGVDGGGTYTRAVAVDRSGHVLSYVQTGGSNPRKNDDAKDNVRKAIAKAIQQAGCRPQQVMRLVAGLSELNNPEDHKWAHSFTALPGLVCPRLEVNDAKVAHVGALHGKPGIVVIAGTGSIIFAVTEDGREIRNYDFQHDAFSSARLVAYETVHRILAGWYGEKDQELINDVLSYCQVPDIESLREKGVGEFIADNKERDRFFSGMAPLITEAAKKGSPLARSACDKAVGEISLGVEVLGSCFKSTPIPLVFIGGVVRSAYMQKAVRKVLTEASFAYTMIEPLLPGAAGAALMALDLEGIAATPALVDTMSAFFRSTKEYFLV